MNVAYGKKSRAIRYRCKQARHQTGGPICQSFGALRLERAVEGLLLECLSPLGVDAMLEAATNYAEDNEAERRHQAGYTATQADGAWRRLASVEEYGT